MRKRTASMTMAGIFLLLVISLCGNEVLKQLRLKGRIPVVTALSVNGAERENTSSFLSETRVVVTSTDLARGSVELKAALRLADIRANLPVYLEISSLNWSQRNALFGNFFENQKRPKTIQIQVAQITHERGTLMAHGAFSHGFHPIDEDPSKVLEFGKISEAGYYSGVVGGFADLDIRIPLDPTQDLPGIYHLELQLQVVPQFPVVD